MAKLAELYIRLDPYEASEEEYRRLGERIHAAALETALKAYGGGVTIEVVIVAGSAKIRTLVLQGLFALDLVYGHMADWKGFKEQAIATYEASATFLTDMAEAIPKIADASPRQVKRIEKRFRASGKAREIAEDVELLRLVEINGNATQARQLAQKIQKLASQIEKDLDDEERGKFQTILSAAYPEVNKPMPLNQGAILPKVALDERPMRVAPGTPALMSKAVAPPPRRPRIVFQKTTELPNRRGIPR